MRVFVRFLIPVCLGGVSLASAAGVKPAISKAREALRAMPLHFEPNSGQWDREVRFAARAGGYSLALTDREAVLSVGPRRVSMSLAGANRNPEVQGTDPLPVRGNFFMGNWRAGWKTGVPLYSRVRYSGVYPGIDLVYYGNGSQLEYDFVLRPGADPSRIRIKFSGADRVLLTPQGDLALDAFGARLLQRRPVVYQQDAAGTRREIAARYRLLDNRTAAVEVAQYDRTRPLIIDPVLEYTSLFGGAAGDGITCMKIDKDGFIWAAGYISDGSTDVRGNFFSNVFSGGNTDVFIIRIDPNASGKDSLAYFSYIGGDGNDSATDIVVDDAGNLYLTGTTNSSNFPLAGASYQTSLNNSNSATVIPSDAFALKLRTDIAGSDALVWSTYLGGGDLEEPRSIAVDAAGKVYLTGVTKSSNFPVTGSAYQSTLWGVQDAFIAKLDPAAGDGPSSLLYSTFLGGEGFDDGRSIVVAPNGSVYAAGATSSTQFPWSGPAYRGNLQGGTDIWLATIDASKAGPDSIPFASYFGGSGVDEVRDMVVDASSKVWLTGVTLSEDYPVTGNAYQGAPPGGGGDAFITCLDLTPQRPNFVVYSSYLGGTGGDVAYGIGTNSKGLVWVAGYTQSADFPITKDAAKGTYPGATDVFVTGIDTNKSGAAALYYSTFLGQLNTQVANGLAVGPDGTVAVAGYTAKNGIQATDNAARTDYAGGQSDAWVAIIAP